MRKLELKDLFQIEIPTDAAITPDGRTVAYVVVRPLEEDDSYDSAIWLWSGGERRRLTNGPRDAGIKWAPDGSRLAFIRSDEEEKPQVWTMRADGGEPQKLTASEKGVADYEWSPDGSAVAYTGFTQLDDNDPGESDPLVITHAIFKADGFGYLGGMRRHLFVVPSEGGEAVRLTEGDFDVSELAWAPDGKTISFASAMHEDRDLDLLNHLFVISAEGGEPKQITEWSGRCSTHRWTPDGSLIVFAGQDTPRTDVHTKLFTVPSSGGIPAELRTDLDRNVMVGGPGYPGAPPRIDPSGETVFFCIREGGCTHLFRVPIGGGSAERIVGTPNRSVHWMTCSEASGDLVFVAATPSDPGQVFVLDPDGSGETQATQLNEELFKEVELFLPERQTFRAPDGIELEGWLIRGGSGAEPPPMLLEIHGGPHNAYGPIISTSYLHRQVLAAEGWNVLFINSRGSDGYGQDFFQALTGAWGEADLDDFMSAVDAVVASGDADPDRLAVTGYSYGGFMTNWITSHTDRFAAAVTGGCVTNLVSQYGTSDFGAPLGEFEIGGDYWTNRELYQRLSPINYVENVTTPMLILHGQHDDRCPVSEAEEWFTGLARQRKIVEMVLYPGASHLFILSGKPSHRLDYSQRLIDWVQKHAAGKQETTTS